MRKEYSKNEEIFDSLKRNFGNPQLEEDIDKNSKELYKLNKINSYSENSQREFQNKTYENHKNKNFYCLDKNYLEEENLKIGNKSINISCSDTTLSTLSNVRHDKLLDISMKEMLNDGNNNKGIFQSISNSFINFKNTIKFNLISTNKQVNFLKEKSLEITGKKYIAKKGEINSAQSHIINNFIYITYKNTFADIKCSSTGYLYSNDCGWGCMIRAAQMILAKAIFEIKKKDKFLFDKKEENNNEISSSYILLLKDIMLLFSDNLLSITDIFENPDFDYFKITKHRNSKGENNSTSKNTLDFKKIASNSRISSIINIDIIDSDDITEYFVNKIIPPFSIQFICRLGELYGKGPGKVFSDINMIQIFDELNSEFRPLPNFQIYWSENCIVEKKLIDRFMEKIDDEKYIEENFNSLYIFRNEYYELKEQFLRNKYSNLNEENYNENENKIFNKKREKNISGAIFISIRLGLSKVSPEYFQSIGEFFKIPYNIGFIGGENFKGFYYIGVNESNELLFLDPHLNQKAFNGYQELSKMFTSFIPYYVYKLPIEKISPALTLGFVFTNMIEFKELIKSLKLFSNKNNSILSFYEEEKKSIVNSSIISMAVDNDFNLIDFEK